MQCTCVRCYNFYHPAPPSIYASLTLLSKSRLPYPSIHLSMPVPPLVQVSAALTIHTSIHPSTHPPIHPSIHVSHPLVQVSSPPSIHASHIPMSQFHLPVPSIHPCLSCPLVQVPSPPSIHASLTPLAKSLQYCIYAWHWDFWCHAALQETEEADSRENYVVSVTESPVAENTESGVHTMRFI